MSGFDVRADLRVLGAELREASASLERLAGGVPSPPAAGVATGVMADMLRTVVQAAGVLSIDALEAASRLDASAAAYNRTDVAVAQALSARAE